MLDSLSLRPFDSVKHDTFARDLFAASNAVDLAVLPEPIRSVLVAQQYAAWTASHAQYATLEDRIVEEQGRAIGRLVVARSEGVLLVVDIAVASDARGRGVGAALLEGCVAQARIESRVVRLTARRDGRARTLYERLGFVEVAGDALHVVFERA